MIFACADWVARASGVLVAVSRRNNLFQWFRIESVRVVKEVRDGKDALGPSRTGVNTRDACATRKTMRTRFGL
jgi:hypothetical protein